MVPIPRLLGELLAAAGLTGEQALTAMNALLNTLQVCFLAYLAAKYQRPPR